MAKKERTALTVKRINRLTESGRYPEGRIEGLYLQVTSNGGRSWVLRYERLRRERWMGLGPVEIVDLEEARERARVARRQLLDGIDPLDHRKAQRAAAALAEARIITFEQAATDYYAANSRRWRNAKHASQFPNTMRDYVFPKIGRLSVADVDTAEVLRTLEQHHAKYPKQTLWEAVPTTAGRIRSRIEDVLDWATTRGYRVGDNPARWNNLATVLPSRGKIKQVEHHDALPWKEVPAFLTDLRQRDALAARALEFLILTAARTNEVIGATWDEIDLDARVWVVPKERMKMKKEHRVPLSDRAVEILRSLPTEEGNSHVFIGPKKGLGLSNMAMLTLLRRMKRDDVTVHGFRSSFRDWGEECTSYPNAILEMALAHVVRGVEAAYRRGDLLDKRRRLMADWAKYCMRPVQEKQVDERKVIAIGAAR